MADRRADAQRRLAARRHLDRDRRWARGERIHRGITPVGGWWKDNNRRDQHGASGSGGRGQCRGSAL